MSNNMTYNILSRARIQKNRLLAISEVNKNGEPAGYTLAQQLEVTEGNYTTSVFMKYGIHVDGLNGLYELRDALNVAIENQENKTLMAK